MTNAKVTGGLRECLVCMPRQRLDRGCRAEGHGPWFKAVNYRTGAYADELDNQPKYHPRTDSDL